VRAGALRSGLHLCVFAYSGDGGCASGLNCAFLCKSYVRTLACRESKMLAAVIVVSFAPSRHAAVDCAQQGVPFLCQRGAPISMAARSTAKRKAKLSVRGSSGGGFGLTGQQDERFAALVKEGRALRKSASDPHAWLQWAGSAAQAEEYAEARQILEAGVRQCGDVPFLISALGQMRRTPPTPMVASESARVTWPGKGDEAPYEPKRFARHSVPEPPTCCPRGSVHPSGDGIICASLDAIIPPNECAWVVSEAERVAGEQWQSDHADASHIGTDLIWEKPFPDRLWLREVPGLLDWFEHRLRTRLFPMLQRLYPDIIHSPDELRCHDAFVVRYDAQGMAALELHQDTTSFSFTIALNPAADYEGGGTLFPAIRPADTDVPFAPAAIKTDVGGVCSFPGRLWHGGNAVESGYRYIIPLFIYLDYNKSRMPRGYLLKAARIVKTNEELLQFPF